MADLKSQMFALYETDITDLREQLSESIGSEKERLENDIRIAEKLLNQTKHYLLKLDENETLLKLEDDKAKNLDNIHAQTISISQQEPSLKDYYESRGQQSAYNDLEKKLDSADSKLRQLEYKLEQNEKDVVPFKDNIRKLENQLDKINKFISENHSPRELRQFFGITVKPIPGEVKPAIKPLPKLTLEKIKCQVCGNMYYPTIDAKQQEEHKIKEAQVKAENEKAELEARKETEKLKAELPDNEPFDYSIHVNQIKEQINQQKDGMKVYTIKELDIKDEISKLDYQTQDEIQKERKAVSVFKIRIQMGEKTLRNIEKLKADCLDLELTNKYLTILHDELLKFVKDKLSLIGSKLNSHLTVGKISLFKLQSNGVLKENFSIIDKHSNAAFEETNTAAKKKLGIEVCLLLQKFNKIFLPIFVDEIQQFANINWIYDITEHQLLATMPSKSNVIDIVFDD
ncbi:hypothetical protein FACS1894166_09960 [Bacilli bacterium]|nr:hypothetical protein FACS1894166_09960 [Bacilli bacterium]